MRISGMPYTLLRLVYGIIHIGSQSYMYRFIWKLDYLKTLASCIPHAPGVDLY